MQTTKAEKGHKNIRWYHQRTIEIPSDWDIMKGEQIFVLSSGVSPTAIDFSSNDGADVGYLQIDDMNSPRNSKFITETRLKFESSANPFVPLEESGTIVFPKRGGSILTNKVRLLKKKCAIDPNIMGLRCNEHLSSDFMFHNLLFLRLHNLMENAGLPQLNNKDLYPRLFIVPPLKEQQNIASILSKVDNLIHKTDEIIEQTKRLKKGMMQKLLTKGIDHTQFKKTEFGSIPESWKIISLESGCKKGSFSMGPFGSDIKTTNFVSSGVPVIRGINLTVQPFYEDGFVFVTESKADELKAANAFPGDLIFTHRGTLGQVGVIPFSSKYKRYVISQSQMKCTCDPEILRPMFTFLFFISEFGQKIIVNHSTKSGVPHIIQPLSSLRKFPVLLPPIEEQDKIVSILTTLDSAITKAISMNNNLGKLKKGLMQKLLTGQIRVKV